MAQALIEKNIVVIGGTGTGKSSFINILDLILRYATLEKAVHGATDFVPLIPVNTEFNNVQIVEGKDKNEREEDASSRTRRPQIYSIKCGNVIINMIDTPGMADSEGTQADHSHVKHITTCLYQFKEIHGIIAFLKSSENTLNSSLKYILNLVLSCLGKTAANMISFVITHAGFPMNPGAAPKVIRKYLDELSENPGIQYLDENSYCFESSPLFYVLSTKKGVAFNEMDKMLYSFTFKKNVQELLRFLGNVFQRQDFYNVLSVPTLILAKQIVPALASLFPFLDSMDEEIKKELNNLEEAIHAKGSEYFRNECRIISAWTDNYCSTIARVEDVEEDSDEDVEKDSDEDVNFLKAAFSKLILGIKKTGAYLIGSITGSIVGFISALFSSTSGQMDNFRNYKRDPEGEIDPVVKRILDNVDSEIAIIKLMKSEKATLYEKFQAEKNMLLDLFCDIISYLEEHAIVAFDDSGFGYSKGTTMDLSSCIEKLKINGQWNPTSKNIEPEEVIARLVAISNLDNFGDDIKKILSKCRNLKDIHYQVVDIQLEPDNVFILKVLNGILQLGEFDCSHRSSRATLVHN